MAFAPLFIIQCRWRFVPSWSDAASFHRRHVIHVRPPYFVQSELDSWRSYLWYFLTDLWMSPNSRRLIVSVSQSVRYKTSVLSCFEDNEPNSPELMWQAEARYKVTVVSFCAIGFLFSSREINEYQVRSPQLGHAHVIISDNGNQHY